MADCSVVIENKREDQIQFLRFVMFLFVFILHMNMPEVYPTWNAAVSAVSFFFMLSGALCGYYAIEKNCHLSVKNIVSDTFRKAKKQYGLYFITTIFAVFWSELPALVVNFDFAGMKQPLLQLCRNFLMIQSWFPDGYFSYNGVGWYLSTLMFLYLLNLPLTALLKKINSMPHRGWISIIAMALCVAVTAVYSYVTNNEEVHFWQYIFPPARIGQYVFAAFLGYFIRSVKPKIRDGRTMWWTFTALEIGTVLFWLVSLYLTPISWRIRLLDGFVPNMLLLGVFLTGKGGISQLFRGKLFVKLGNLSADCYLLHQIVIHLFFTLSGVAPQGKIARLLCMGFCLWFTVMVAFYLDRIKNTGKH